MRFSGQGRVVDSLGLMPAKVVIVRERKSVNSVASDGFVGLVRDK
jgi:hypothetical protein